MLQLKRVDYEKDLNSRQKENYNFSKVSALLADYGYVTIRLSDDWQGADFIALHVDGSSFLRVQLKGRLGVDVKYQGKGIWVCFRDRRNDAWYLYPHDDFLTWLLAHKNVGRAAGFELGQDGTATTGAYTWPGVPKDCAKWLKPYRIPALEPVVTASYDKENDVLYIKFSTDPVARTESKDDLRLIDYTYGRVVGVEFVGASEGLDLHDIPRKAEIEKILTKQGLNFPIFA